MFEVVRSLRSYFGSYASFRARAEMAESSALLKLVFEYMRARQLDYLDTSDRPAAAGSCLLECNVSDES